MHTHLLLAILLSGILAGCASDAPGTTSPTSPVAPDEPLAVRDDSKTFTLGPDQSIEWKFRLSQGAQFEYSWSSTRPVGFDFHGDRDDGTDDFVSHKKGTLASDSGTLTIPFEGRHGWYYANGNAQTVTITLSTRGPYEIVGRTGGNSPG